MSEYNELYQAVQPESPQVVPDEVRFVYIPKAQKGTPGLAWFNEEHFIVSDDSEVSLSAMVLGDIDKKLDKVIKQPESKHGQVYAIYGDGREDPQTMWDLDDTGEYSDYHIPNSDGRGYLKVKDPIEARNPVNKQFLDEKLKGKLDDLGKTSGVFPAAYVRQQGMVVSHDYGKSIEVNSGPTAYTIPVRTADGTLQTATPRDGNDAVNLDYLQNYNTKILHIESGTGSRSLKFNVTQNNDSLSSATNAFGNNTVAGLIGVRYSAITNTADEQSLTLIGSVSGSPFEVGDELNIVNDSKYDRSCKFVKYENGKIYVDKLPFTEIVSGDTGIDAYMISSYMNPQINGVSGSAVASYGIAAFAVGADVKAVNAYTFGAGFNNIVYGEYGTAFGRDNEVGYCGFAAGRGNVDSGAHYAIMLGKSHILSKNADNSTALGSTHSIDAKGVIAGGQNNTASAGANWSSLFGYNNTLGENTQYGILLGYGNSGTISTSDMTSPGGVIAIGENNVISRKWGGAIGRTNTIANFATFGMGLGLTSTKNYQSLFGAFNETDGDINHMDEAHAVRITGGGGSSTNSRMTLEVLTSSGDLHLMGKTLRFDGRGSNPVDLTSVNVGKSNRFWKNASYSDTGTLLIEQNVTVRGLTSFQGTFVAAKSAQFNDDVAIAKNLDVAGNFTVTGTTTVKDVKNLAVEDLTITLGKNSPGLGASLAGLVVPDYNGMQQPGGLVFDDTGTAYVGDVDRTSDGTVSIGNAKPIAVRSTASEWSENSIPRWSSMFDGFEPSGYTPDSFLQKQTDSVPNNGYFAYVYNGNTQSSMAIAGGAAGNSLARRTSTGALNVTAATENLHAVNLKQLTDGWVKKHIHASNEYDLLYGQNKSGDVMFTITHNPVAYAIPSYSKTITLQTNEAVKNYDCVNLKQMKAYALEKGTAVLKQTTTRPAVYGTESGVDKTFRVDVDGENADGYNNTIPIRDNNGILYASNSFSNEDGVDDREVANIGSIKKLAVPLPENQTPTVGQTLEVSSMVDGKPVMVWVAKPDCIKTWKIVVSGNTVSDSVYIYFEAFANSYTGGESTDASVINYAFSQRIRPAYMAEAGTDRTAIQYVVDSMSYDGDKLEVSISYFTAYPFTTANRTTKILSGADAYLIEST